MSRTIEIRKHLETHEEWWCRTPSGHSYQWPDEATARKHAEAHRCAVVRRCIDDYIETQVAVTVEPLTAPSEVTQ